MIIGCNQVRSGCHTATIERLFLIKENPIQTYHTGPTTMAAPAPIAIVVVA